MKTIQLQLLIDLCNSTGNSYELGEKVREFVKNQMVNEVTINQYGKVQIYDENGKLRGSQG